MSPRQAPVTTEGRAVRDPELLGQTVVVIGGSAGIGLQTARRARAEGADVILTGREPDRLEQAAQEVGAQRTAAFDASDAGSPDRFFRELQTIDQVMATAGAPRAALCSRWMQPRTPVGTQGAAQHGAQPAASGHGWLPDWQQRWQ